MPKILALLIGSFAGLEWLAYRQGWDWLALGPLCLVLVNASWLCAASVSLPDDAREEIAECFRAALADCNLTLKQAAAWMQLNSASDLLHALKAERKCDLFWRLSLLPIEAQRAFHFRRVQALGLPTQIRMALKMAQAIEGADEDCA